MAEEKSGLSKGLLIGFVAGAIAGAITALLYAPKSGKELRSDLKQKAEDLKRDAGEYAKAARAKAMDIINKGKSHSGNIVAEVSDEASKILDDADKVLSDIRERVADEGGRIKTAFRAGAETYKANKDRSRNSI